MKAKELISNIPMIDFEISYLVNDDQNIRLLETNNTGYCLRRATEDVIDSYLDRPEFERKMEQTRLDKNRNSIEELYNKSKPTQLTTIAAACFLIEQ